MAKLAVIVCLSLTAAACDGPPSGGGKESPYQSIEPDRTVTIPGLDGPVDVVRDEYGIPHIWATTTDDAAFADGYVMAADRMSQLDLFRHFASGTISENFGALAPEQIDGDIRLRMHMFRPLAEQAWTELTASTDPLDQELVGQLQRFSDGINAYLEELKAGEHDVDSPVWQLVNIANMAPWSPVDSLTIGRLQAWALSFDDHELRLTTAFEKGRTRFPAMGRAGAELDLFRVKPMDRTSTIDGWPNVGTDSGSRAKPQVRPSRRVRPSVDVALLESARRALAVGNVLGLRHPGAGSNNWVVGPELGGGSTLLANDPHLQLSNPPIWYFVHLTVAGHGDMEGGSFAGLPGVLLGHNEHIAWGATVVNHDVTDFYLETIVPCSSGTGDCVIWNGGEVPIETRTETLKIGTLGTIMEEREVTFEIVPHHGPIIPTIQNGQIVPRTGSTALSVRYTGYEVTQEVRAFYGVTQAASVMEARDALQAMGYGAQNFVIIDDQGHFGWTSSSLVPWRSPACFTYSEANRDGVAPFLVVPGDGTCEWESWMDHRYLPHAFDPPKGYLATANADPVGETFDGDPLNGPIVGGRPLYASAFYDSGFRVGRITRRLEELAAAGPITAEGMASVQADAHSNVGEHLRAPIVAAVAALAAEIATPGSHPDLTAFASALPAERRARIGDAAARLDAWTLDTPAGTADAPAAEIADSVATTIVNAWLISFVNDALGDELAAIDEWPDYQITLRTTQALFEEPTDLTSGVSPVTMEPILCDDLATAATVESCTLMVVKALDEALTWAEGALGADVDGWRWGLVHTLTLTALTPQADLNLPPNGAAGYPRHGENHTVDVANSGLGDHVFTFDSGPSMRHITVFTPGEPPRCRNALPGGNVFDPSSPHYSDLAEDYWLKNEYFDFPWSPDEVIAHHETRWVLSP